MLDYGNYTTEIYEHFNLQIGYANDGEEVFDLPEYHQDYGKNGRILVTEKVDRLIFRNEGSFFQGNADDYYLGQKTRTLYRNPWLVQAMVHLGMIDTMGYGIHTMALEQSKRYFPLPDYTKSEDDFVELEIYGHTLDENYSLL